MIRAIAVGNEPTDESILRQYIATAADLELVAFLDEPRKVVDWIGQDPTIGLVFELIGGHRLNGSSLGGRLPAGIQRVVVASRPDEAREAFKQLAADYLLSPFSREQFEVTLQKVRVLLEADGVQKTDGQEYQKIPGQDDVIMVKVDTRMVKLHLHEITHIKGEGNYVTIYTTRGKWLVYHTMKKLEETLSAFQFIRVHKSYIVSFQHIDMIEKHVLHIRQEEIPISDSYKDAFLEFVNRHSWMI
jgi:DNA-binding LytR/AlgR family response regulator